MENYCLALGIKGYKKWQQAWARKTKEADEEEVEKLNHLRVKFVEKIDPLMFVSRQKKKTVLDITLAVYEFIAGEHLQEKLEQQQKFFAEQGELTLAKEYEQIYRIVMELFDKFSELLGDEPITLKEYCELLDAGFEEAKVGVIPPSIDQVVIGDVERTRMKDIRALFFVGANDVLLPGNAGTGQRKIQRERYLVVARTEGKNLYTEILFIYGADKTDVTSKPVMVKGVGGGKISASGVFDTGASQAVSESVRCR